MVPLRARLDDCMGDVAGINTVDSINDEGIRLGASPTENRAGALLIDELDGFCGVDCVLETESRLEIGCSYMTGSAVCCVSVCGIMLLRSNNSGAGPRGTAGVGCVAGTFIVPLRVRVGGDMGGMIADDGSDGTGINDGNSIICGADTDISKG